MADSEFSTKLAKVLKFIHQRKMEREKKKKLLLTEAKSLKKPAKTEPLFTETKPVKKHAKKGFFVHQN